jgi:hypothetical protein
MDPRNRRKLQLITLNCHVWTLMSASGAKKKTRCGINIGMRVSMGVDMNGKGVVDMNRNGVVDMNENGGVEMNGNGGVNGMESMKENGGLNDIGNGSNRTHEGMRRRESRLILAIVAMFTSVGMKIHAFRNPIADTMIVGMGGDMSTAIVIDMMTRGLWRNG